MNNEQCPGRFEDVFDVPDVFTFEGEYSQAEIDRIAPSVRLCLEVNVMPGCFFREASEGPFRFFSSKEEGILEWRKTLRSLSLRSHVLDRLSDCDVQFGEKEFVGVHLRRTDNLSITCKGVDLEKCDELLKRKILESVRNTNLGIFIASDDRSYSENWKAWAIRQGIDVLWVDRSWRRGKYRQTSIEEVVFDIYMLSRSKMILASFWSSVCFLAGELGDCSVSFLGESDADP